MNLRSSPTIAFTIPSVYDKTQLDCRIYIPRELKRLELASTWWKRGGIIAHPYAPLGGCYDDPVVSLVGGELLQAGYVVGTFNFRGAGDSDGRTSWTARPELADYVSLYCFLLYFLHILKIGSLPPKDQECETTDSCNYFNTETEDASAEMEIVLGGYSYGSMIASHLPTIDVIVDLFREIPAGTALYDICKIAERVAARWEEKLQKQVVESRTSHDLNPVYDRDAPAAGTGDDGGNAYHIEIPKAAVSISYLLVSPLLPPISQLLTVFSTLSLNIGAETSAQGKHIPCPKPADQLCSHRTLAIYGNQDTFTSAKKLRRWSDEMARGPCSTFQYREVDGAGHFWREDGVEEQARNVLRDWLCQSYGLMC